MRLKFRRPHPKTKHLPFDYFYFQNFRNCVYVMMVFVVSSPIGALVGALLKELLCEETRTTIVLGHS